MKCNWSWETLQKQGSVTMAEAEAHKKVCKICQDVDRKKLKDVAYWYPIETGWKSPKCPFCFSEIPAPGTWEFGAGNDAEYEDGTPIPPGSTDALAGRLYAGGYKTETCPGCGAIYSYDPASDDSETIPDVAANLLGKKLHEVVNEDLSKLGIDVFIYHNYAVKVHAFNDFLTNLFDVIEDNGPDELGHLWFVRKRKEGEAPFRQPVPEGAMRHVIKEVIELLEKTRSAFKSKLIAEARVKLEKLL